MNKTLLLFIMLFTVLCSIGRAQDIMPAITERDIARATVWLKTMPGVDEMNLQKLMESIKTMREQDPNWAKDQKKLRELGEKFHLDDPAAASKIKDSLDKFVKKSSELPGLVTPELKKSQVDLSKLLSNLSGKSTTKDSKSPETIDDKKKIEPTPDPDTKPELGNENAAPTPPELTEEQIRKYKALAGMWEEWFGPIDQTPGMKELLQETVNGVGSGEGKEWGDFAKSFFTDSMDQNSGGALGGAHWDFFRNMMNWGIDTGSLPTIEAAPVSAERSASEGSWLSVILFFTLAAGSLVGGWFWLRNKSQVEVVETASVPVNPWPIDPRTIDDREAVVKAFEHLSVLLCGKVAKSWNHLVIARALERIASTHPELAKELAGIYAEARYRPRNEPLPEGAVDTARRHICSLAGVTV